MVKSVLITGANGGLGKECARQLALQDGTEKVYLGCRSEAKAKAAKRSLEESTGKSIFEIVLMDVSDLSSVRSAVSSLDGPIDGLVMNAGGMGGPSPGAKTSDGVTQLFATNVLGHVVLLDELLKANKLTGVALYAGSEGARGVLAMGMKRPELKTSSVDECMTICDGSMWPNKLDPMVAYGPVKYIAALWMSSLSRRHPDVRFVTMSPGGTSGTEVMNDLPPVMKFMFTHIGLRLMPLMGLMHKLELGAKRYVDGLNDD
ncbi:MAG: NAD(P)-dependent dehydrogenase (short-subunit alcohol dehydrogenase family), partial [Thalassolituus oleivorans]